MASGARCGRAAATSGSSGVRCFEIARSTLEAARRHQPVHLAPTLGAHYFVLAEHEFFENVFTFGTSVFVNWHPIRLLCESFLLHQDALLMEKLQGIDHEREVRD